MLLSKQVLLPETKRAFSLFRAPFDDLQSAEDMYVSPDIRYIRESMYQVARHDGCLAVVGESGAGKSTLRRDLINRLAAEGAPVLVKLREALRRADLCYNNAAFRLAPLTNSTIRLTDQLAILCEAYLVGDTELVISKVAGFAGAYQRNTRQMPNRSFH